MQSCASIDMSNYIYADREAELPLDGDGRSNDFHCIYTRVLILLLFNLDEYFVVFKNSATQEIGPWLMFYSSCDRLIFFHDLPYFYWLLAMLSLTQTWRMGYSAQIPSSLQLIPVTYPLIGLASQVSLSYTIFLQCSWFKFILSV